MGRDYESSKPLPMHLNITPESAGHYVRRALATLICTHEPEQMVTRPCRKCLKLIEPQVMPVAKALTWAITESRIAVGAAVEILVRDADFELQQFIQRMGVVRGRDLLPQHQHRPVTPVADREREGEEENGDVPQVQRLPTDS